MKILRAIAPRPTAVVALALLVVPAAQVAGQVIDFVTHPAPQRAERGVRLSDDMTLGDNSGDVMDYLVDDSGTWVVYRAQGEATDRCDLYSVPADRSAPATRLSGPGLIGEGVQSDYAISADGTTVVYRADAEVADRFELYSVPIDASATATKLNDTSTGAGIDGFAIAPDSASVAFHGEPSAGVQELFRVPIDGVSSPLQLGPSLAGGREFQQLWLPAGGLHLVYLADQDILNLHELYTVPYDGSGSAQKINDPLQAGGCIYRAELTADSTRMVFTADPNTVGLIELYSAPVDASASPTVLSPALGLGTDVLSFHVAPDSASVAFVSDLATNGVDELYGVPIDGSSAAVKISGTLVAGGDVDWGFSVFNPSDGFAFDSTGARVIYLADQDTDETTEIYSTPVDGSSAEVRLNRPLLTNTEVDGMATHLGSTRVVFSIRGSGHTDIYSIPATGGNPNEIDGTADSAEDFAISSGGQRVSFLSTNSLSHDELYSVPITGGASPLKHSGTFPAESGVESGSIHDAADLALYIGDQEFHDVLELFAGPAGGATTGTRLSAELVGDVVGDVSIIIPVPGSRRAIYRANQDHPQRPEYFVSDLRPGTPPVKLNAPLPFNTQPLSGFVTPDGGTFIYVWSPFFGADELRAVPTSGMGPEIVLASVGGDFVTNITLAPDGVTLYFQNDVQTYSVPIDGSAPPSVVYSDRVFQHDVTPDGSLLVFNGFIDPTSGVYTMSTDGLETLTLLSHIPPAGEFMGSHEMTPDGTRVIYETRIPFPSQEFLWSVPVDGSAAPVRVSPASTDVETWWLSPDGSTVIYRADQDTQGQRELYAAPSDGSSAAIKISVPMIADGDVQVSPMTFSPDSSTVVYRADANVDGTFELYASPITGGGPHAHLSGTLVAGGTVMTRALVGAAGYVVYEAFAITPGVREIFSAPIDGSSPPVRLNAPLFGALNVQDDFEISPDGLNVAYRADTEAPGLLELYLAPITGESGARRVSAPADPNVDVIDFAFVPDGSKILYLADHIDDEAWELFYSDLKPVKAKKPSPGGPAPLR